MPKRDNPVQPSLDGEDTLNGWFDAKMQAYVEAGKTASDMVTDLAGTVQARWMPEMMRHGFSGKVQAWLRSRHVVPEPGTSARVPFTQLSFDGMAARYIQNLALADADRKAAESEKRDWCAANGVALEVFDDKVAELRAAETPDEAQGQAS